MHNQQAWHDETMKKLRAKKLEELGLPSTVPKKEVPQMATLDDDHFSDEFVGLDIDA